MKNFSLKALVFFSIAYIILFFSSHLWVKIPKSWDVNKPFDRMIIRHRIVCCVHGVIAQLVSGYVVLFSSDFTCGRRNTYFEQLVAAHTFGYLAGDFIYMVAKGFLDIGNFFHHMFALLSYGNSVIT